MGEGNCHMNKERKGANLLIHENPMVFQPSLAIVVGLNEAIVLQQIQYWQSNIKNAGYEYGGYKWVYNTMQEWQETNFPFWGLRTVERIFSKLSEKGFLISIQMNKGSYDHTKCYRIDYDRLENEVTMWRERVRQNGGIEYDNVAESTLNIDYSYTTTGKNLQNFRVNEGITPLKHLETPSKRTKPVKNKYSAPPVKKDPNELEPWEEPAE
jgi:hypothetical protein